MMPPVYENIPSELKARPQWVVWRQEEREGQPTKIPYQPRDPKKKASSTNPDTWGTFEQALSMAQTNGFHGIGYVFSPQENHAGVDLDHCRNPGTGVIEPWAREIIDRLQSYTEISPSGCGVHILIRGTVPPGGNKKGKVEMYSQARYFTTTGHQLEGTPTTIEARQTELEALHREVFGEPQEQAQESPRSTAPLDLTDLEIIAKAKSAQNGDKFDRLMGGDITGYPSASEADMALCSVLAFWTQDPGQIDRIYRTSGLYRNPGRDKKWNRNTAGSTYGAITIAKAIAGMTETYQGPGANRNNGKRTRPTGSSAKGNGETGAASNVTEEAPGPGPVVGFNLTDLGNARRLVAQHGQDLRYCHLSKKWWIWTGAVWAVDTTGEIIRRAKLTVAQLYQEAAAAGEKEREAIAKFALRSEHEQRIKGMIRLAESEPSIPVTPGQMDANPWLLNCLNGTVDLKTGKLRPHDRGDLITRMAPIEFDPLAPCPLWEKFLDHIQKSNQDVISFIQRILGYALTGDCREQCLFLLWGGGANGKSTLLAIVSAILGKYAMQTPTETLLAKQKGEIPNDIARLNGPRFVTAIEVSQGRRLAESLVKQLTGQDTIAARFLFGEYFDFKPQFKIFLGTNHKPIIKDTSHAMWRRIRLIPFPVKIPDKQQDKELPEKLQAEAPGILAWMVRGCLSWQHGGLGTPDEVIQATGDYQQEMDVIGDFILECCNTGPGASATAKELYQAYGSWAESNGEKRPVSQRAFGMSLTERGFDRKSGTGNISMWWGIGLKHS
jgi:putative DNA primase/helicase